MSQSNRALVDRELEKLDGRLRPFIVRQMSLMYGASWQQEAQKSLHHPHWTKRGDLHLDLAALLHILWDQWESIFHQRLSLVEREIIKELLRARNDAFHQWPISDTKVERVLRSVEHLLTWISPTDSFSRPPFTQANTTRSNPRPGTRTSPDWQDLPGSPGPARTSFLHLLEDKILDLPSSPRPARTPGQPRVSRRALLIIATGVAVLGVPILCELSQPGQYFRQPDPTAMTPQPTPTLSNTPLFTYTGHPKAVNAVVWSPDGQHIASGSDDTTVQVWNASNGNHIFTYTEHSNGVDAVAWSPDGQRIVSGSASLIDTGSENLQVWNASNGNQVFTDSGQTYAVAWSPDGQRIASTSNDGVQVWNASNGSRIFTYRGHSDLVDAVVWSPDGKHIASGSRDDTVQVWNANDGTHVFTYTGHSNVVNAVAWSPNGQRIASGSQDNTVQVWNASDGSDVLTYTGHNDTVYTVAWSPDGQRIASGSRDNTVQVWQAV